MSSRWYPIYSKGNPQLRVFLPNFWMKMVTNKNVKRPPNSITFQVSPAMTQLDVKNYLEKIYKVPVLDVKTKNVTGKTEYSPHFRESRELFKDDDIKYAFVTVVSILIPKYSKVCLLIFKVFSYQHGLIWTYTLIKIQIIFLPTCLLSTIFYFFYLLSMLFTAIFSLQLL